MPKKQNDADEFLTRVAHEKVLSWIVESDSCQPFKAVDGAIESHTKALVEHSRKGAMADAMYHAYKLGQAQTARLFLPTAPSILKELETCKGRDGSLKVRRKQHPAMHRRAKELRRKFPSYSKHRVACMISDENPGKRGYQSPRNIELRIEDLWDTADPE